MYIYWKENICLKFVIVNTMTTFYPPTHCISLFKKLFWCIQFYGIESAQKKIKRKLTHAAWKDVFSLTQYYFSAQIIHLRIRTRISSFCIIGFWMIRGWSNIETAWRNDFGQRGAKIKRRAFCSTETSMIKFEAAYNFIFPGVCMHSALSSCLYLPHFDVLVIIFQFSTPPLLTT